MTATAIHDTGYTAPISIEPLSQANETTTLNLVYRICQALEAEKVTYCHWKSNAALDRSARGDNDLDLLVSRADGKRFAKIMHDLGLKQAEDRPAERLPGVLSYYGYDPESGKLVHVHTHYQLVLGQDRTKNYRLPLEEPYLASTVQQGLFRVPSPEFELIVFTIRMVIKHLSWDAVLTGQGSLSPSEQQELIYLQARVDWSLIQTLLARHLPSVDSALFEQAVESLLPSSDLSARLQCAQRLQRQLAAHARGGQWADVVTKVRRRVVLKIERRLMDRPLRKTLVHGGALIALVGGDGAGKSTAVQELRRWLSKDLSVRAIHLGKPPRSWSTLAVDAILKVERDFLGPSNHSAESLKVSRSPLRFVHMLRAVCTARDRARLYARARRLATNGEIVICDRYPLAHLKLTDGPLLPQVVDAGVDNRFVRWMAAVESRYVEQIAPPELLVVLRVDPEIAVLRRNDEDAAWVRRRAWEIYQAQWEPIRGHVIDAGQSKEDVLAELKSIVWANL